MLVERTTFEEKMFPRLRLAIEHNHKEFVGHIYSQQILSQVWYGKVPWQDRSRFYKVFHVFMLVSIAPFSAILMFVCKIKGTTKTELQFNDLYNQIQKEKHEVIYKKSWINLKNKLAEFLKEHYHYSFAVPLNRFWTSVCYYFIFLSFLMSAILTQVSIQSQLDLYS